LGAEHFRNWLANRWSDRIRWREPLAHHTSWRVGGPCDLMVFPSLEEDLKEILEEASRAGEQILVMGRGTNLLVRDGGVRGTVINLSRGLQGIEAEETRIKAGAGWPLSRLAGWAARRGLGGLEFAAGIPGTLGGGAKGNAGAFGFSLDRIVRSLKVIDGEGREQVLSREQILYSYRGCSLPTEGIIVEAELTLTPEDPQAIWQRMEEFHRWRRERQPLSRLTAGSVFKNPTGLRAGRIIESLGLKGKSIGGARVSEVHANFIENLGNARASDILELIRLIQERVEKVLGQELELEVQVVGEG